MALKRTRHPDMNINDLDASITYQIYHNFDVDRGWEQLAGVVGYSTIQIHLFEREVYRSDGSPTRKLLWDWGTRGGTVRNLYEKLELISKIHVMRMLDPIMKLDDQEKGKKDTEGEKTDNKVKEAADSGKSNLAKGDNLLLSIPPDPGTSSYNPSSLPVPVMKMFKPPFSPDQSDDVNINKAGNVQKNVNKSFNNKLNYKRVLDMLSDQGAASVESNECQADGPPSGKGQSGAAEGSALSFQRVLSVVEDYGSQQTLMSQLSADERTMALALMSTPNYTYKELSQATNGFNEQNKLGEGKFGAVYRGSVKNTSCAIKRLFQKQERNDEDTSSSHLSAELRALTRYRHENIVTLYGYALDGDEVCLVYQFMPNGSLHDCLHRKNNCTSLDWVQRLGVLRGAACGLQFLHSVDSKPVIHGDVKSANILLDRHFEAKVGDLGLAQQATGGELTGKLTHITKRNVCSKDYENRAYEAPEIARGSGFSIKGDAYAFGVVMFECLTGLQAYDNKREGPQEKFLVAYIEDQLETDSNMNIQKTFQDSQVKAVCPQNLFLVAFNLAQACTMEKKKDRPTMVKVFEDLEIAEATWQNQKLQEQAHDETMKGMSKTCNEQASDAGSTHMHHLSLSSSGGYSPGVKATPPPGMLTFPPQFQGQTLVSPVDYLPPDQLPEAVKLQVSHDNRRMSQQHIYENVAKLSLRDLPALASDPKKLAELEKCDNDFKHMSNDGEHQSDPKKQKDIDEFDGENMKTASDEGIYPSDPKKLQMLLGDEVKHDSKVTDFQGRIYENFPVRTDAEPLESNNEGIQQTGSKTNSEACSDTDGQVIALPDLAARDAPTVTDKPIKKTMLDMLDTSKYADMTDDDFGEEFGYNYDDIGLGEFDMEDSGSSTITGSVVEVDQLDSLSGINDDDLYGSNDSEVVYVNVPSRRAGASDALLQEHQQKWAGYQALTDQGEGHMPEGHIYESLGRKPTEADGSNLSEQETNNNSSRSNTVYGTGGREPTEDECYV